MYALYYICRTEAFFFCFFFAAGEIVCALFQITIVLFCCMNRNRIAEKKTMKRRRSPTIFGESEGERNGKVLSFNELGAQIPRGRCHPLSKIKLFSTSVFTLVAPEHRVVHNKRKSFILFFLVRSTHEEKVKKSRLVERACEGRTCYHNSAL